MSALLIARPERTVIDTNVLVSALLFVTAVPRQVVVRAFECGDVLSSPATRNELREVMRRSKFDRYAAREFRMDVIEDIIEDMEPIAIFERIAVCRDPKDDKFLELLSMERPALSLQEIRICWHCILSGESRS